MAKQERDLVMVLKDLHRECKAQGVRSPTDLSNCDEYIGDFLRASPDTLTDYLNLGEMPDLETLVPDLFDERQADPAGLVEYIKREMRSRAREAMDTQHERALFDGVFAWMDAA